MLVTSFFGSIWIFFQVKSELWLMIIKSHILSIIEVFWYWDSLDIYSQVATLTSWLEGRLHSFLFLGINNELKVIVVSSIKSLYNIILSLQSFKRTIIRFKSIIYSCNKKNGLEYTLLSNQVGCPACCKHQQWLLTRSCTPVTVELLWQAKTAENLYQPPHHRGAHLVRDCICRGPCSDIIHSHDTRAVPGRRGG